jgi:hypothetical protein
LSQTLYKASAVHGATQDSPLNSFSPVFDNTVLLSLKPITLDSATYVALCGGDLITNQPDCVLSASGSMFKHRSMVLQRCACINMSVCRRCWLQ